MKRTILWYAFDFALVALATVCCSLMFNHPCPQTAVLGVLAFPVAAMVEQGVAKLYMTKKEYFEFCNEV